MRNVLPRFLLMVAALPVVASAQLFPYGGESNSRAGLRYSVDLVGRGWTESVREGDVAGTAYDGTPRSVRALRIDGDGVETIRYRVMNVRGEWGRWATNGSEARADEQQVAAIQIQSDSRYLGLRFRVFSRDAGWSPWRRDGEAAEARGREAVQALQIELGDGRRDYPRDYPRDDDYRGDRYGGSVEYSVDIVGRGWTQTYNDGEPAGTVNSRTPRSIRALRADLNGGGDIRYRVRDVRGRWSSWQANGSEARSNDLQIDAIQLQTSSSTSIRYRVYTEEGGWSGWQRGGSIAEARGRQAVQAVQIELERSGRRDRPGRWDDERETGRASVAYEVDLVGAGWTSVQRDGQSAGSERGVPRSIRGIRISARGLSGLRYRVMDVDGRWSRWTENGEAASVNGNQIRALQVESRGREVRYQVYSADGGWSRWASDGEVAESRRQAVQAVRIEIR